MGHISVHGLAQLLLIGVSQVQITAQHSDIHLVAGKHIFNIHGKPGSQRLVGGGKLLDHLGKGQVPTGKTQIMHIRDTILEGKRLCVM